ncbi:hypothetical protein ACH5RR_018773 [Cinchona calisaya]|uniref:Uncharacterized protein n=1 Tax=Cinchona calisaya TaxID=153742 RepID=A0ABD2ZNB7_9GENT
MMSGTSCMEVELGAETLANWFKLTPKSYSSVDQIKTELNVLEDQHNLANKIRGLPNRMWSLSGSTSINSSNFDLLRACNYYALKPPSVGNLDAMASP